MVSVIIPVYNDADYLTDLLNDVLKQTYTELEIIIINDGSTDASETIIHRFQMKDKRIRYIRQDHQGVSVARNIGLEMASGQYIRFLDADDRLDADSMESMVMVMEQDREIDLICGRFNCTSVDISYSGPTNLKGKTSIRELINDFSTTPRSFYYGVVWNKLYRKELISLNNIKFDEDIDWCEDMLFNLKYYEHSKCVFFLQKSIYQYVRHEDSVMNNLKRKIGAERIEEIDRYRYQKVIELIEKLNCIPDDFTDTWAYLELRREIYQKTDFFSGKHAEFRRHRDLHARFRSMKEILNSQEKKDLLRRFCTREPDVMEQIIYKNVNREHYFLLFCILLVRDYMSVHSVILKRIWRKYKKR